MDDKTLDDPLAKMIDTIKSNGPMEAETDETDNSPEAIPDDTAEEITPQEALLTDIPVEKSLNEVAAIAELVCDVCLELNLKQKCTIQCKRCDQAFCYHYTSNVDADYCVNCMSDISVTKSVITKSYETISENGEKHFYRRKARDIKFDGLDWLFAQRKIPEYSDSELELTIEYHQARLNLMLAETERRRTAEMHRYAGVKVVIPTTTGTNTTSTTVTKKVRTVSKNKVNEQLAALMKSLLAQGMTPETIAAALGKK